MEKFKKVIEIILTVICTLGAIAITAINCILLMA